MYNSLNVNSEKITSHDKAVPSYGVKWGSFTVVTEAMQIYIS